MQPLTHTIFCHQLASTSILCLHDCYPRLEQPGLDIMNNASIDLFHAGTYIHEVQSQSPIITSVAWLGVTSLIIYYHACPMQAESRVSTELGPPISTERDRRHMKCIANLYEIAIMLPLP